MLPIAAAHGSLRFFQAHPGRESYPLIIANHAAILHARVAFLIREGHPYGKPLHYGYLRGKGPMTATTHGCLLFENYIRQRLTGRRKTARQTKIKRTLIAAWLDRPPKPDVR